jgi:hypothetical protein
MINFLIDKLELSHGRKSYNIVHFVCTILSEVEGVLRISMKLKSDHVILRVFV